MSGVKLFRALAVLFASLGTVSGTGWDAPRIANNRLDAVVADGVQLLRDPKERADFHAVDIAETAHQARNGHIDRSVGYASGNRLPPSVVIARNPDTDWSEF